MPVQLVLKFATGVPDVFVGVVPALLLAIVLVALPGSVSGGFIHDDLPSPGPRISVNLFRVYFPRARVVYVDTNYHLVASSIEASVCYQCFGDI